MLLRHITRYHPFFYRGPIRCVYCNFGCSSNDEWVKHQKEMHKYICKTCQQSFTSRSGIYTHNKVYHGSAESLWKCSICDKGYGSSSRLKLHEQAHASWKLFRCAKCGKGYKYKYSLDHHKCKD